MSRKVQVSTYELGTVIEDCATLSESVLSKEVIKHAYYFSALIVNGGSVEVINLDVRSGSNRMGHWAGVFQELM